MFPWISDTHKHKQREKEATFMHYIKKNHIHIHSII